MRVPSENKSPCAQIIDLLQKLPIFVTKRTKTIHRIVFLRLSQPPHKMLLHFDGVAGNRSQFQPINTQKNKTEWKNPFGFVWSE